MPQERPDSDNPEEIDTSETKRVLEQDPASSSPSDLSSAPKKRKTDKEDTVPGTPLKAQNETTKRFDGEKTTIEGPNRVDPAELASAFALASLASLSPRSNGSYSNKEETRDVKQKEAKDQKDDGVRNVASWDETRSPKADHHPLTPDQRSPGSASNLHGTPPSVRKVTFAPSTKETSSPSTPLRARLVASRRLTMPRHRAPHPPNNNNDIIVSSRPYRMFGGMPPPYVRTPPHIPNGHHMHHGPPPPPHHPAFRHRGGPTLQNLHGAFHHASMSPQHPHHYSPVNHWHGGPPAPPQMGYAPRHLLQPPLIHRSSSCEQGPPVPPHPRQAQGMQRFQTNQWICDFCNVASFGTYEEACIHEESCKLRTVSRSSSSEEPPAALITNSSRSTDDTTMLGEALLGTSLTHVKKQDWFDGKLCLAMEESDREWLSDLHCYVRKHCVEAFSATQADVSVHSKQGRITLQQVGIRCCFCAAHAADSASCDDKLDDDSEKSQVGGQQEEGYKSKVSGITAVLFPPSVNCILESVQQWQRVHLDACTHIPDDVRDKLSTLASTAKWVPTCHQYWVDSACALGLVDTNEGIRFGKDPATIRRDIARVPSGEEFHGMAQHRYVPGPPYPPPIYPVHHQHPLHPRHLPPATAMYSRMNHLHQALQAAASIDRGMPPSVSPAPASSAPTMPLPMNPVLQQQHVNSLGGYIVVPQDMDMIPPYVYFLLRQVEPCLFTEADRFVARSKGPVGYPGFQCRHCTGHAGLGKYFPISSKALSTNSTSQNIHAHLLKCRKCPDTVKERLVQLKIEKSRAARLEPGWRKVFFDRVWARLHHPSSSSSNIIAAAGTSSSKTGADAVSVSDDQDDTIEENKTNRIVSIKAV